MTMLNPHCATSRTISIPGRIALYLCVVLGWSSLELGARAQTASPVPDSASISVSSIVTAYAKGQDEKEQVTKEINAEQDKKTKLVASQTALQTKQTAGDHQARLFNDAPPQVALRRDLANYKATCEGKMHYGAEITRCDNAAASIRPRLDHNNKTMNNYFAQYHALGDQIQQAENEIVLADAKIKKLQNYLSWLTDANNKISTTLHQDCAGLDSNPTIEDLKHRCGNIQFDNARADLQPCTSDSRCASWQIYTKPSRTPEQAIQDYKNSGNPNASPNAHLDSIKVPSPGANSR